MWTLSCITLALTWETLPKLWEIICLKIRSPQRKEPYLPHSILGPMLHGQAAFAQSEISRAVEAVGLLLLQPSWKTDSASHLTKLFMWGCHRKTWSTVTSTIMPAMAVTWLLRWPTSLQRVWWVRTASHTRTRDHFVLTSVIARHNSTESMLARPAH